MEQKSALPDVPTPVPPHTLAGLRKIRVLISSRNGDLIPDTAQPGGTVALSTVREDLKLRLECETLCGEPIVEVWINEAAGAQGGDGNLWHRCLVETMRADIVVVIYNGEAGWTNVADGIGICHAELQGVLDAAPAKLRLIRLRFDSNAARGLKSPDEVAQSNEANRRFAEELDKAQLFGAVAADRETLVHAIRQAVVHAVCEHVEAAARAAHKGKPDARSGLDWSRLTYPARKREIEHIVSAYLVHPYDAVPLGCGVVLSLRIGDREARVWFVVHAVPDGFGIAEARELVGRPYLADHESDLTRSSEESLIGPIHVIACYRSCTERQVCAFIGHPDVYRVAPRFGFLVADPSTFAQAVFLKNCFSANATRYAVDELFRWLNEADEIPRLVRRAAARAAVVRAVAQQAGRYGPNQPLVAGELVAVG